MAAVPTAISMQAHHTIHVATHGQGLYEITDEVRRWVAEQSILFGLLTIFCRHTSASLTIQENADPDVQHDLDVFFSRLVREDPELYSHVSEGDDDMPAHIRAALTDCSLSVPVTNSVPALGTWQGIYLFEHRRSPHQRQIELHVLG